MGVLGVEGIVLGAIVPAMLHKELTQNVIDAAKSVHNELGAGLPHAFYCKALEVELADAEIMRAPQWNVDYQGTELGAVGTDFSIDESILVRCVESYKTDATEYSAMRALLKLSGQDVGLLLNFNGSRLDVRRVEAVPRDAEDKD